MGARWVESGVFLWANPRMMPFAFYFLSGPHCLVGWFRMDSFRQIEYRINKEVSEWQDNGLKYLFLSSYLKLAPGPFSSPFS